MREEKRVIWTFTLLMFLFRCGSGSSMFSHANPLQILSALGIQEKDFLRSKVVGVDTMRPLTESPIYYIKLPPLPPMFSGTKPHQSAANEKFLHKLDLEFTNNGRPEQIYHWNYKPNIAINVPDASQTRRPPSSSVTKTPVRMPPEIPLIPKVSKKETTLVDKSFVRPLISLDAEFVYNGRPNNIYIWKAKQRKRQVKPKHPYFKHFNY
ncbi:UNVERIFIED_CONTAM: hypothetical protein RMT77_012216 [Armadillidium vulgare]